MESISICVCTCKRPDGLRRLLESLSRIDVPEEIRLELLVVDNDPEGSALSFVEHWRERVPWPVRAILESRPGVSHARNRCVTEANGEWIAFIDDDEWVPRDWMQHLIATARRFPCDIVMAPVQPMFEVEAPAWVQSSGAFGRDTFETGVAVSWQHCASGNVLMRRVLHQRLGGFDVSFGASGGEDTEFFYRCEASGARAIWCQEAQAFEGVPAARLSRDWVLRRCEAGGRNYARIVGRHAGVKAGIRIWLRGLLGLTVYGSRAVVARVARSASLGLYERRAAMGFGKMTPWMGSRQGHYGDARER